MRSYRALQSYKARGSTKAISLTRSIGGAQLQGGNDIAGIRLPELTVPLATYTGSRTRIAQTSFGFSGRFWPMRRPLFQGERCEETSAASMPSMVVSSDRPRPPQHGSSATRSAVIYRSQL